MVPQLESLPLLLDGGETTRSMVTAKLSVENSFTPGLIAVGLLMVRDLQVTELTILSSNIWISMRKLQLFLRAEKVNYVKTNL